MSVTLTKGHMIAITVMWLLSIIGVLYVSTHTGGDLSSSAGLTQPAATAADALSISARTSGVLLPTAGPAQPTATGTGTGGSAMTQSSGRFADPVVTDLYDWARRKGAVVNVEPGVVNKGGVWVRGAIATKDIKVGDVVLSIPRPMVMTEDTARKSPIGRIFEDGPRWTEEAVFTFFVLWIISKPQDSGQWQQFGKVLARTTLGVPALMSEAQLEAAVTKHKLNPERMKKNRRAALSRVQHLIEQYVPHIKRVQPVRWFTDDMLSTASVGRANVLFTSRYWKLDFPNHEGAVQRIGLMAPMADMLNMGRPGTTLASFNANDFDGRGGFRLEAGVAVEKGAEVEFYYGSYCTEKLFSLYGFVTPDTPKC